MRDELDGRLWAEHHEQFSRSVTELIDAIRLAFRKLNEIEYEAPWRRTRQGCEG